MCISLVLVNVLCGYVTESPLYVRCSVLHCVAVCCSVLQCVAVCRSVLQCVAVCCNVPCVNTSLNLDASLQMSHMNGQDSIT